MIQITQIQSEQFTSNVYVLTSFLNEEVFLIDCGGFEPVLEFLRPQQKVKGVFLTHYHYDHIYYLSKWIKEFPNMTIYGSKKTWYGIKDPKINLSFYHEDPLGMEVHNFQALLEPQEIKILDKLKLKAFETEGHCDGSLTFQIENYLFTGDTLIPNIPTVTKLKTGSKEKLRLSIEKIKSLTSKETIICPGHLNMIQANEVQWGLY